ncbi:MAG: type II toxin-antitoxin system VapC family toxin [Nitrospinae bacterium]|nr:type II toxin-antitoxin system VapC family toxin [Nitrospinota bacterium]
MTRRLVLDNSVVMSWCFEDAKTGYTSEVLKRLETGEALTPAIWPLEVGNVLLVAERKKRISKASSIKFLSLLGSLPIRVEQESPERMTGEIMSLAREQALSTYDASYLDLAMRLGLPIATLDEELIKAAKNCGVPKFDPRHGK